MANDKNQDPDQNKFDYKIGYKKPPKQSQFKAGQSGNRKGRPKGSMNFVKAMESELAARVTIKENGKNKLVSKIGIIIKQLINKAAAGDLKAVAMLLNQALLNEQSQLAKGTPVPEAFVEEDQMVLSSIAKRIRESIALEPVINAELVVTEVESEPSMTEPIVADTDTDTDTDIGDYIFIDEDIYVDEDIVNGDLA